jgi:hypothetical protein
MLSGFERATALPGAASAFGVNGGSLPSPAGLGVCLDAVLSFQKAMA